MAHILSRLADDVIVCETCFRYAEATPCEICSDEKRDKSMICIVEESRDIATIESTGSFRGNYHVLGGTLSPIEGMTPETLRMKELTERLSKETHIEEIILALSPTVQGETTMMYLSKELRPYQKRITRLARGLPIGASLEYADEITLGDALKGRRET